MARTVVSVCLLTLGPLAAATASPATPVESMLITQHVVTSGFEKSLGAMSTGAGQAILLAGDDARSQNRRIPMASGKRYKLPFDALIDRNSSSYEQALKCLTQAVYYEAANETRLGKRAVAQVVLNRLRHPAYPNSVCGVVYQGVNNRVCQFSFTCDGALLRKPLIRQWRESENVARNILAGDQVKSIGTATHYHADYVVPKWAYKLAKTQVIGTHIFYRFPGSKGLPREFTASWTKSERMPEVNWSRFADAPAHMPDQVIPIKESWVPGLTVAPDKKDRHASNDVGGRLDTTKTWRLTIPDPQESDSRYSSALQAQSDAARLEHGDRH